MRPILLLLLVAMIASAVWLSFGRVEARAESIAGARASHVVPVQVAPTPAQVAEGDIALSKTDAALVAWIDALESTGVARISADEADAQLSEAHLPRTLHALRGRFADAYIALRSSGVPKEAALAALADFERDALSEPASAAR